MSMKRRLIPPLLMDSLDRWRQDERRVIEGERRRFGRLIPGSTAYGYSKRRFLLTALSDQGLLARFRNGLALPDGYGVGLDERCVEYPWLVGRLDVGSLRLLDAGSTLNYDYLLDHPRISDKAIHIVTLAPEKECYWRRGISYVFADFRDLPLRDGYYDAISCISTLEHVGADNSGYGGTNERQAGAFVSALSELRRVLRPGGRFYLTVPFGRYEHFGWFQQFDRRLLTLAEESFGPVAEFRETFFRYSPTGWRVSTDDECADSVFVQSVGRDPAGLVEWPRPVEPDHAAAARAVACVEFVAT